MTTSIARIGRLLILGAACWTLAEYGPGVVHAQAGKLIGTRGGEQAVSGHVAIIGAVTRAGAYELHTSNLTLTDVVQLAGGLSRDASGNVRVIRKGRGGFQTFYSAQSRYPLWDGDVVVFDRRPSRESQVPTRGPVQPSMVSVALVNLVSRPVVVDLPLEYASVRGLLHLLRSPLTPQSKMAVMPAGRSPQTLSLPLTTDPIALASGTVVVFDPATVIARNLPPLPPAIRPQDAVASQAMNPASEHLDQHGYQNNPAAGRIAQHPSSDNPHAPDASFRRPRVQEWKAGAQGPTRTPAHSSIPAQPTSTTSVSNSPSSPLLSIPNPTTAAPSVELPDLQNPLSSLATETNGSAGAPLLVTASTAAVPGTLPGIDRGLEVQSSATPIPTNEFDAAADEDPKPAPVKKKSAKQAPYRDVFLAVLGSLAVIAGAGFWLKHRAAIKLAGATISAGAATINAAASAPNQATPAASVPQQQNLAASVPAASVGVASRPSTPAEYDVVMPPAAASASQPAAVTNAAQQPGLLDRALASVHSTRRW